MNAMLELSTPLSAAPRAEARPTLTLRELPERPPPVADHRLTAACMSAVLDELDTGVLLCGPQCQVMLLNEAARRELADGGVLRLEADGRLAIDSVGGQAHLRRAVHNAACNALRHLVPLQVGDRSLMVAVQPLAAALPGQQIAVLLLGRRQLAPGLAVEMLAAQHALTLAEQRVLKGLLDGRRVSELADSHGVAVSTVRTQVATLRAKFGVRSIDALVRIVAEMPPMMSALRSARRRCDA